MLHHSVGRWVTACVGVGAGVALAASAQLRILRSADPAHRPDRVILTWTGDPATTQAVTWRSHAAAGGAFAEIAVEDGGPLFPRKVASIRGESRPFAAGGVQALSHSVEFTGLRPETLYVYRVGNGRTWSEWFQFRTASQSDRPFSFIYFGDAQNDLRSLWSRIIRRSFADAPDAAFFLHAGDLVNTAGADSEWGEWFGAGGWLNAMIPSIPTPGNHEYARIEGSTARRLTAHWRPQFALPLNGPTGLEETAYYLDFQGVRIVSLNSNEKQEEQAAWLDRVLEQNSQRWVILAFHHPIYSTARGRDNANLRKLWLPVIRRHRVDLVLQGHDHTYARSNLTTGLNKREEGTGTVFVVSVSGPKMYNLVREPWMRRAAEDTQMYQVIRVAGRKLKYRAYTAAGVLYDGFDLEKPGAGRPNRLRERVPSSDERRRPPAPTPPPAAGTTPKP